MIQAVLDTVAASISEVRKSVMRGSPSSDEMAIIGDLVARISKELTDAVGDEFDSDRFNMLAYMDEWERYL